jgi:peptidoglycan/LPS O-acetylase OafA/YrhL
VPDTRPVTTAPEQRPPRTLELDILRGVAALLIVVHHWRFFYFPDAFPAPLSTLPLWPVLEPLYMYGELIVDLFFTLSGYVFFWLFADSIAERRLTATAFFQPRFARLYPLFFATLIAVALLQPLFRAVTGADLVYTGNNVPNFINNLLLVQNWSYIDHQTFNGPAWSISAEVLLYILFFAVCRLRLTKTVHLLAFTIAGIWAKQLCGHIATGIPSFFLGGLAFHAVRAIGPNSKRFRLPLMITAVSLWIVTYIRADTALSQALFPTALKSLTALLTMNAFWAIVAPITLIALVVWFRDRQDKLKPWAWLGDISYSVYLLHFPLMLAVSLALSPLAKPMRYALVSSPLAVTMFLAVLIGLARLCHDRFEMPAKDWLRRLNLSSLSAARWSGFPRRSRR